MIIIQALNNLHYTPRLLEATVEAALKDHPVVVLTGARQTGKTTLVKNLKSAGKRVFRTLDDLDSFEMARRRPDDLLAQGKFLTLDEVQRVPELLLAIKRDVDRNRRRGRFLLTGSANLLLMRRVADSLAGRAVYLSLLPFTKRELNADEAQAPWSRVLTAKQPDEVLDLSVDSSSGKAGLCRQILTGGMPLAVLARSARERSGWFDGYIRTYVERDLRDISAIESLPDFRRLMGLATARIGQIVNQAELGSHAGLSQPTAHRYLNLLEITFQIHRVPAFSLSRSRRLIKSPKLYWGDTGIAAYLAGFQTQKDLESQKHYGSFLENLVLLGLLSWRETARPRAELTFWRTASGAEVDFIIERGSQLLPVEVKAAPRIRAEDGRALDLFLDEHPKRARFGVILHGGDKPAMLTRRIVGLPIGTFI